MRDEFAAFDHADGQYGAVAGGVVGSALGGGVAAAQDDRLATADAQSLIAAHDDAIKFCQAGFDAAQGMAGCAVWLQFVKRG